MGDSGVGHWADDNTFVQWVQAGTIGSRSIGVCKSILTGVQVDDFSQRCITRTQIDCTSIDNREIARGTEMADFCRCSKFIPLHQNISAPLVQLTLDTNTVGRGIPVHPPQSNCKLIQIYKH